MPIMRPLSQPGQMQVVTHPLIEFAIEIRRDRHHTLQSKQRKDSRETSLEHAKTLATKNAFSRINR
jgi:hypothetical protein